MFTLINDKIKRVKVLESTAVVSKIQYSDGIKLCTGLRSNFQLFETKKEAIKHFEDVLT